MRVQVSDSGADVNLESWKYYAYSDLKWICLPELFIKIYY